jgi:pimeloyl-ACP methyl ester carboxylesterase
MPRSHRYIQTNGVTLHIVTAGPENGRLLIFLHGFPEYWRSWEAQIDAFAATGFYVWVPDQRGYNLSEKPQGIAAYNLDELAADVVGLIDAAGADQAYLVGHDWGGTVAWWTANKYPGRIARLGILNVPHHGVLRRQGRRNWRQLARSWYMGFFQLPWLPERVLRTGNWRPVIDQMVTSSRPGTFGQADIDGYRDAWSRPGAMRAMLNWYRALFRQRPQRLPSARIEVPTLLIWGKRDRFLRSELSEASMEWCDYGRLVFIDNATHWVQHEEPATVNRLLLDFFYEVQ